MAKIKIDNRIVEHGGVSYQISQIVSAQITKRRRKKSFESETIVSYADRPSRHLYKAAKVVFFFGIILFLLTPFID